MQFYAYYLPQFHEVKENNEWWGEGFTEWTNVKKAEKLFKKHNQPQLPLNGNYYNLLKTETLNWQADLAAKYGVDGFIFYHYYFTGRLILEKPAELLLKNPDIPMNFFFCWANHSWNRAWKNSREVLIEQVYGGETDWKNHFEYLLKFFKDGRYLKINNKPVLMIFNPVFEEKNAIFDCFDKWCRESGFDGIHIIESCNNKDKLAGMLANFGKSETSVALREPDYSYNRYRSKRSFFARAFTRFKRILVNYGFKNCVAKFSGKKVYRQMQETVGEQRGSVNFISGLYFAWDNTPRHSARGYVITPIDKNSFFEYMNRLNSINPEYVFINAWNEWAEGMMLEPTENEGYKYLEWIKEWKETNKG